MNEVNDSSEKHWYSLPEKENQLGILIIQEVNLTAASKVTEKEKYINGY